MSQLLQRSDGVEFWQCAVCGRVRRILARDIDTIFLVPPEFCSARCMREYSRPSRRMERALDEQMTLLRLPEAAA
jgi:hypothetical protein